jgi:hypothetical protein
LRQKVERTEHTEAKVLPLAESWASDPAQDQTPRPTDYPAAGAIPSIGR